MRDYRILRLSLPASLETRLREEIYRHPCLGLEFAREGACLAARAYFEADYPLASLKSGLLGLGPSLVWVGETCIRLAAATAPEIPAAPVTLLDQEIRLRGGPAFGSGAHPTTRLAAELLDGVELRGRSVLDVGAGSGVLALFAWKRGAGPVTAAEILPEARENAAENFRLNGAGDIALIEDLAQASGSFDIVVANILSPTLIALGEEMVRRLKSGGTLALSGILKPERESMLRAFSRLSCEAELELEGWLALRWKKA